MTFEWGSFRIHLKSLNEFCIAHVPKADGIIAGDLGFEIVEREPFDPSDVDSILGYMENLTESGEEEKFSRPGRVVQAISNAKHAILAKSYKDLTVTERKLVLNLPLDQSEEDSILLEYGE